MPFESRPSKRLTQTPSSNRDLSVQNPTVVKLTPTTEVQAYLFPEGARSFLINNSAASVLLINFNDDTEFFQVFGGKMLETIRIKEGTVLNYKRSAGAPFDVEMIIWG